MYKKYIFAVIIIIALVWIVIANKNKKEEVVVENIVPPAAVVVSDYRNMTYQIEGQSVTLKDGYAQTTDPETDTAVETRYFGNHVTGDFNGDGFEDVALLLTRNPGGSGTFYYLA